MMREYGSFFELDLKRGCEYYRGRQVKRLNTARAGILYSLRLMGCKSVVMPFYLCPSVAGFLRANGIHVSFFRIGSDLFPIMPRWQPDGTAVLIVNYFGLLPPEKLAAYASAYKNVIIDNSQAFYSLPVNGVYNIYSPRKFFGVPDGCYVIGPHANREDFPIANDASSESSIFLLKRLEQGCEAAYEDRQRSEARLSGSGMRNMSALTQRLLESVDYEYIKERRISNFKIACQIYSGLNLLDLSKFASAGASVVPMVYPLVVKDEDIAAYLRENRVYVGRWWEHVAAKAAKKSTEFMLSKYMLPLPVDQRMDETDAAYIHSLIANYMKNIGSEHIERKDIPFASMDDRP
jgi:hypothetical protein